MHVRLMFGLYMSRSLDGKLHAKKNKVKGELVACHTLHAVFEMLGPFFIIS